MTDHAEINCYAHYPDEYHHSDEWATKVLNIWIEQKRAFVKENHSLAEFRFRLQEALIEAADWESQFTDAANAANIDFDTVNLTEAYEQYKDEHFNEVYQLIPSNLYTEFRWIPEWVAGDLDELIETHGLRSDKWRSCDFEDILPGEWLARFLRLVNVSSDALVEAVKTQRPHVGTVFAERVAEAKMAVAADPQKSALLTPLQVIEAVENSYYNAIPVVHAEINLRTLLNLDPRQPITLTSDRDQKVHLGLHDFVNGAGYMDMYKGKVVISAKDTGFTGKDRWSYGINATYGLVPLPFWTKPTNE